VPALESWIDAQARAGRRFGVLGDFNRQLTRERLPGAPAGAASEGIWAQIDDGDPPEADLVNAADGQRFRNCVPGQGYAAYIDHIVLSRGLADAIVPGSFGRVTYSAADARRAKLSDHCPVAVRIRIQQIAPAR
jgi:endonuclease/exonuclease/phosphatase family metal-dependent hydrolase